MKIKKGFTLRTIMGQNIVLAEGSNADTFGKMIRLNSSAAMLWNELNGRSFDVGDAADLLTEHYGIDRDRALADATGILDRMTASGLLDA